MTEDKMVRWHHRLNGHEFEQTPGAGKRQESLAYCSSWGCKELDMTEQLNHHHNKHFSEFWEAGKSKIQGASQFNSSAKALFLGCR